MKVSEVMTPTVLTINGDSTVIDAARKMRDFDVGFLAVVSDYSVLGTLTDRDIVIRALARETEKSPFVKDIMTRNPITCTTDSDIEDVAQLLSKHQIQRILVIDETETPVGVLSIGDLASKVDDSQLIASTLKTVKKDIVSKEPPWIKEEQRPAEISYEV
ncbi:CBS domain-containing protein [Desulfomonile tiedjei]|uniref:CBS domain-containing protein n=1 Tax=Desulfomonile tiedjei (strain ATCC 49306 / DSM 6799 / DCB-1) TaxID=706587 RepID=I4CEC3_DESTA|nr:CBS domain-containing protein [Desulfomonile tiedjei]AFM27914.1 CBS domain-containing protein [Desulfomonile tiedjei DSM 6799]